MAKRRLEYLLLLLTVLLFHILLVNYLSFYLLLFFLILPVLSLVGLLLSGRAVRVELKGADRAATRGEAVPFAMAVENGGFISAGGVAVRLEIINQFTQARQEEELFLPGSRGRWEVERQLTSQHFGAADLRLSGPVLPAEKGWEGKGKARARLGDFNPDSFPKHPSAAAAV